MAQLKERIKESAKVQEDDACKRTFHHYRENIQSQFGITVECNKSDIVLQLAFMRYFKQRWYVVGVKSDERRMKNSSAAVDVHLTPDVRIPLLRGDALSRARARVRVRPAAAARLSRHRVCLHGGKRRALRAVFPRAHGRDDPARLCMECAQMAPGLAVLTPGKLQKSRYCL